MVVPAGTKVGRPSGGVATAEPEDSDDVYISTASDEGVVAEGGTKLG